MACMEHFCVNPQCDWMMLDNASHAACPKCGAKVRSYFDEQPEQKEGLEDDNDSN